MGFIQRLQNKWNLNSSGQVIVVLIVFACTGTTIFLVKPYVQAWMAISDENSTFFSILYYIFILPIYNIVLLFYGFVFGQFSFFWNFEKRMWDRMTKRKKSKENGPQ